MSDSASDVRADPAAVDRSPSGAGSRIGFHASHEQFAPGRLLELVSAAERAGFGAAMCSDHFHPWSERQGHSGYAWSWLGAALQATGLSFGTVCAPVQRYHPAIVAQAIATLGEMFPGRFWVAFGSGELLNERVVGGGWPSDAERDDRLEEALGIVRALLSGEKLTHHGRFFRVVEAKLYGLPDRTPPLFAAAVGPEAAARLAPLVDGLITVSQPREELEAVIAAFREAGGDKPLLLQSKHSYAGTDEEALQGAFDQWRTNLGPGLVAGNLALPEQFDAAARFVRPEDMHQGVRISSDLGRHAAWLADDLELGFDRVYVHNVNREQQRFIDAFAQGVLPQLA